MWQRTAAHLVAAATLAALTVSCSASSQAPEQASGYPSHEIRLSVPYTAGGPTDVAARAMGEFLERRFGHPVIVENKPGAAGSLAMTELAKSDPDGYSLTLLAVPATVVTPMIQDVGYGPTDYQPVGVISQVPSVLAVATGSRFADAAGFFDAARGQPGKLTVGTPGATTSQAIELRRLAGEYGITVTAVPFNGNAEIIPALLNGSVDAILVNASRDIRAHFDAGEFRPLAVSPAKRVEYLPSTPTLSELGFPNLTYSTSVFGLAAPKGTPPDILGKLEEGLRAGHADPAVRTRLGEEYVPERFIGATEFRAMLDKIVEVYGPVAAQLRGR